MTFDRSDIARDAEGVARYQNRPASIVAMLRATVDAAPASQAIKELNGPAITYRELWEQAARVAGGLRDQGVKRGDRVAIRLPNSLDWCLAFFGAQLAGAIAVPVNMRFSDAEADYVIQDSGSGYVFTAAQPLPNGTPFAIEDLAPRDVSAIFYTSGTTGFPKGAMTTHENFLANMETCRRVGFMPPDPARTLVSVPLFHVTGCNSQLLPTCESGGTTVIMPAFNVRDFLHAIPEERIDVLASVPAIYWLAIHQPDFAACDTSRVRRIMYGGAAAAPELIARIVEAFPNARVSNSYGLTETSSMTTFLPAEYSLTRPESVGLAAPVIDLKLTDVSGDVGELLIRGQNVVAGYWRKPDATAEAFADGWLRSGDLARLDAGGFLQIVDRKKDMVNRGGENVYCVEVESALTAHPAIFEVAVLGVPDEMMGEKVGAVIVPKPGHDVQIEDVIEFASSRLADFKVPQYMVVRSEFLPRNPGGKILKKTLRETIQWGKAAAMTFDSFDGLVTDWFEVTQQRIDAFAEATEDRQWIHTDPARGPTIAHGFLTLSLLSHLSREVLPADGVRKRINYGLNRVRFPAPVKAGARIRARFALQSQKPFDEGVDVTLAVTVEIEGGSKPCCVAEWIVRYYAG